MQNNFFGFKLNSVLLLILIILVVGAIYIMFQNEETYFSVFGNSNEVKNIENTNLPPIQTKEGISGNKDDLISFSIAPYMKVHDVLSYRGVIKGGYFFEANILINILDTNKKLLKASNAIAKTNWMTAEPVEFEGNINFNGLAKGPAYFEIHNDNASGLPENDKFILIPIIIE